MRCIYISLSMQEEQRIHQLILGLLLPLTSVVTKKHPHFQVGLFDDLLFIWLAFIYELPGKQSIAKHFLEHQQTLKETIPAHYMVSLDHTKKESRTF